MTTDQEVRGSTPLGRAFINGKWLSLVEHLVWDQGVAGSNPVFPIFPKTWGLSSAGRAPALHAGGQRFDPARLHFIFYMSEVYPSSAEGIGLENRQAARVARGFESLYLLHFFKKWFSYI
ncbi:conserved hypothetical protein [Bacillus mycoides]|uniref:Uncharacterized protein n=1 Tax=Bacillus mycoides TaxID=1405 RepID=A0A653M6N6_BACMY|nr:conserved hypothetical protein [Bacillus mycoides]